MQCSIISQLDSTPKKVGNKGQYSLVKVKHFTEAAVVYNFDVIKTWVNAQRGRRTGLFLDNTLEHHWA